MKLNSTRLHFINRPLVHSAIFAFFATACLTSVNELDAGQAQIIAQSPAAGVAERRKAQQSQPGNETQIGYGGGVHIPEIGELKTVWPFLGNWHLALSPSQLTNRNQQSITVCVNSMLDKRLETKSRMDLKSWVQTLFVQGGEPFVLVNPWMSVEELDFGQYVTRTNLIVPDLMIEAEVACYDEEVLTKQTGLRLDLLFGANEIAVNPSMRTGRTLNNSVVIVQVRVKRFSSGKYDAGASAIVGATLAEKSKNIDLGLFVRGSGIGYANSVNLKPALQQAILRCCSRAVMIATARAMLVPYWHVLPEFPEDDVVREQLRKRLADSSPEENAIVGRQIQSVLADPFRERAEFQRCDIVSIMHEVGDPIRNGSSVLPREMPTVQQGDILVEFVGFPDYQRQQVASAVEQQMASRMVRHAGDWYYTAMPKRNFSKSETRRQWGEKVCSALPTITGRPCQVVEISPTRFQVVNSSSF